MKISTLLSDCRQTAVDFTRNRVSYTRYVVAILSPGHPPPVIDAVDRNTVHDISAWTDEDVELLLDEGRRSSDAGAAGLAEIRARSQVAFSTCLVLFGALVAQLKQVRGHHHHPLLRWLLFAGSSAFAFAALAGSLAILVIQLTVPDIHPAVLTTYSTPVKHQLARDYAANAVDWHRVNGTTRTALREALLYLTLAGLLDGALWILCTSPGRRIA